MSDYIEIKGARVNNLKNVDVKIPRGKLVVVAGVSGSGKSSLAFDTLYAEGQRRYVESLSSYARQFLGRMNKPECDFIKGIPPAIAIEQRVISRNPRSTVGTTTEIYEYLRLLYARIGRTYSPISGQEVKKHSTEDIIQCTQQYTKGTKFVVMAPVIIPNSRCMCSTAMPAYSSTATSSASMIISTPKLQPSALNPQPSIWSSTDCRLTMRKMSFHVWSILPRQPSMRAMANAGLCSCPR